MFNEDDWRHGTQPSGNLRNVPSIEKEKGFYMISVHANLRRIIRGSSLILFVLALFLLPLFDVDANDDETVLFATVTDSAPVKATDQSPTLIAVNQAFETQQYNYENAVLSANTFQNVDGSALYNAGQKLMDFADQYYLGFWVGIGGTVATIVGAVLTGTGSDAGPILVLVGQATIIGGSLLQLFAFGNVRAAGRELKEASGQS